MTVYLTGTSREMRRDLFAHAVRPPLVRYAPTLEDAVRRAKANGERPLSMLDTSGLE